MLCVCETLYVRVSLCVCVSALSFVSSMRLSVSNKTGRPPRPPLRPSRERLSRCFSIPPINLSRYVE